MTTALEQLLTLTEDDGVYLEDACSPDQLNAMRQQLKTEFNLTLPDDYFEFLAHTNGAQINNAVLEDAETLIEATRQLHEDNPEYSDYVMFGQQGNLDSYVYHQPSGEYQVTSIFSLDDVFESYPSFDSLLNAILQAQLNDELI